MIRSPKRPTSHLRTLQHLMRQLPSYTFTLWPSPLHGLALLGSTHLKYFRWICEVEPLLWLRRQTGLLYVDPKLYHMVSYINFILELLVRIIHSNSDGQDQLDAVHDIFCHLHGDGDCNLPVLPRTAPFVPCLTTLIFALGISREDSGRNGLPLYQRTQSMGLYG